MVQILLQLFIVILLVMHAIIQNLEEKNIFFCINVIEKRYAEADNSLFIYLFSLLHSHEKLKSWSRVHTNDKFWQITWNVEKKKGSLNLTHTDDVFCSTTHLHHVWGLLSCLEVTWSHHRFGLHISKGED